MTSIAPSDASATRKRLELAFDTEDGARPAKRRKFDDPVIRQIASIVQIRNSQEAKKNTVWMNKRDVCHLFSVEERDANLEEVPRYVRVADQVYQISIQAWLQPGMIGMNSTQIDNSCNGVNDEKVVICAFKNEEQVEPLASAVFNIEYESPPEKKQDQPAQVFHVQELRDMFDELYCGQFLSSGQSIFIDHPSGTIEVTLKEMNLGASSAPWPSSNHLSRIGENTRLDFQTEKSSGIVLVDKVVADDIDTFHFTIKSVVERQDETVAMNARMRKRRGKSSEDWNTGKGSLPLVVTFDDLEKKLKDKLRNENICPGNSVKVNHNGYDITVEFNDVTFCEDRIVEENLLSEKFHPYEKVFKLESDGDIEIDGCSDVVITEDTDESYQADEMRFEVVKYEESSKSGENTNTWLSVAELKQHILDLGVDFVCKQRFSVKLSTGTFLVELVKTKSAEIGEDDFIHESFWYPGDETEMKFKVGSSLEVSLVDNAETAPAESVNITVDIPRPRRAFFDDDNEPLMLTEADLQELLNEVLPNEFSSGQKYTVTTEDDKELTFTLSNVALAEKKDDEVQSYGVLSSKTEDTKFNFTSANGDKLIITKEAPVITTVNTENAMEGLGLGGLSGQFKTLIRTILLSRGPMKKELERRGVRPVKGMLLYGPPGTGKTTLARNLGKVLGCDESRVQMIAGPQVWNKWLGESEANIRKLFAPARAASDKLKDKSPLYVVIIDEIEAILGKRSDKEQRHTNSVVDQFLGELDGLKGLDNILVVGLTNHRTMLDPAILRSGRFDVQIEIGIPDTQGRQEIFQIHTKTLREEGLIAKDVDFDVLVSKTKDWTGADIEGLVRKAVSYSIDRLNRLEFDGAEVGDPKEGKITMRDFFEALLEMDMKPKDDGPPPGMYI
ncbi:MAG: SpoVK/Ycf46/Vps4 family AAA+-type ATPase [Chlamydiales bacterium]|jgi:SpoVK/Ycf46/Vps4 family AAA+-type ATPase